MLVLAFLLGYLWQWHFCYLLIRQPENHHDNPCEWRPGLTVTHVRRLRKSCDCHLTWRSGWWHSIHLTCSAEGRCALN